MITLTRPAYRLGPPSPAFTRHFPDTEVVGRDLPSLGGAAATKFIAADSLTAKTTRCSAPLGRNSLLCVHQGVPLPSSAVASDLISRSRWCGRRPQLGDQHQDFLEHLPRHRDLGRLEGGVAAVTDDLAPILISFSRKLVSDHGSAVFGIASVA